MFQKNNDFKNFVTEENISLYPQLCQFQLSELSENERNIVRTGNIVLGNHTKNMTEDKSTDALKGKNTFTIGCTAGTFVMSLNDSKYAQDGVLAFASPKDFYLSGCIFSKKIYLILCWNL